MANRGQGRKLNINWDEINKVEVEGKIKAECKYCKTLISSKIERIKRHLQQCSVLIKKRSVLDRHSDIIEMREAAVASSEQQEQDQGASTSKTKRRKAQSGKFVT